MKTEGSQTYKKAVFKPAKPLTLLQLIDRLQEIVMQRPAALDWHVHILDMDGGDENTDPANEATACLVTTAEVDKFSDEQGWVVSLCAEREVRDWSADGG